MSAALAQALGLSLDQTEAVLNELDRRLPPLGLLVHRLTNTVKIWPRPDAVRQETLEFSWRAHLARQCLDIGQAHLLHTTLTGRRTKTLTNHEQVTTNELVNAGILTRAPGGGVGLAYDVRYSVMLSSISEGASTQETNPSPQVR